MTTRKHTVWLSGKFGNMGLGEAATETGALRKLRAEMGDEVKGVRFGWEHETPRGGEVNRFGYFAVTE